MSIQSIIVKAACIQRGMKDFYLPLALYRFLKLYQELSVVMAILTFIGTCVGIGTIFYDIFTGGSLPIWLFRVAFPLVTVAFIASAGSVIMVEVLESTWKYLIRGRMIYEEREHRSKTRK